MITGLVA